MKKYFILSIFVIFLTFDAQTNQENFKSQNKNEVEAEESDITQMQFDYPKTQIIKDINLDKGIK